MKILFTGSSSFTGYWFIRALVEQGHQVVATFRGSRGDYLGVRAQRVQQLLPLCQTVFACPTGSAAFTRVIQSESHWDLWCHHAADVTDYKSPSFDALRALRNNCEGLPEILHHLRQKSCYRVLLTGSVFEQREGAGDEPLLAFSPYGLSKGLTADYFAFYVPQAGLHLGKFVIPNPFGPLEEERFTHYLVRCWLAGKTAQVSTPAYVRDNIHVSLLAKAYAQFAAQLPTTTGFSVTHPSGYVETQGEFTERFAREMAPRLGIPCPFELAEQVEFPEPRVRTNSEPLDWLRLDWDEKQAWDELAAYYRQPIPAGR